MKVWLSYLYSFALVFVFFAEINSSIASPGEGGIVKEKKRIVLVGASIGKEWNLPELPKRVGNDDYVFESLAAWQFDKTEALEETLMRPKRKFRLTRTYLKGFLEPNPKPADVIIIKECSSYFPGKIKSYKKSVLEWIEDVKKANKQVMLATVVPVTKKRAMKAKGKLEMIIEYNDWIRDLAKRQNLPLLDLEIPLRTDSKNRYLKEEYTSGDGSHLNQKAYKVLDKFMIDSLCVLEGKQNCQGKNIVSSK